MLLSAFRNHRVVQHRNWRDREQVKKLAHSHAVLKDHCVDRRDADAAMSFDDPAPTRDGVMGEGEIRNRGHADQR